MVKASPCPLCKHLLTKRGETPRCNAFPDGIPMEIIRGDVLHLDPIEGDNGIQYERIDEKRDFRRIFRL